MEKKQCRKKCYLFFYFPHGCHSALIIIYFCDDPKSSPRVMGLPLITIWCIYMGGFPTKRHYSIPFKIELCAIHCTNSCTCDPRPRSFSFFLSNSFPFPLCPFYFREGARTFGLVSRWRGQLVDRCLGHLARWIQPYPFARVSMEITTSPRLYAIKN